MGWGGGRDDLGPGLGHSLSPGLVPWRSSSSPGGPGCAAVPNRWHGTGDSEAPC